MKDRVFGIESEYALIYHPGRHDRARPKNLALYRRFDAALCTRLRSLPNAFSPFRAKVGRFLENGSTFHYEANVDFEDGLIEMASPECRDPYSLVVHERAKDELLEELAEDVNGELALAGYTGRARVGKNNVDSAGNTFGSHENYWVEDHATPRERFLFFWVWLLLWIPSLPVMLFVLGVQLVLMLVFGLLAIGLVAATLALSALRPTAAARLADFMRRLGQRLETEPGAVARQLHRLAAPIYPLVALHAAVYNRFQFRDLRRGLTAFLVTRTLFAGAGRVVFDGERAFRLAQRPGFVNALSRIFLDGDQRPLFETRELFFRPWTALRRRRRLHLLIGDANLSEFALALRVGTTALVIEAIERTPGAEWPELANPLDALSQLNADLELQMPLDLSDGRRLPALELQRHYLARVRGALLADLEPDSWKARILRDWEETLDALERDPNELADRLDWVAKKNLLERRIDPADWAELPDRGADLLERAPATREDARLRDAAFRLLQADLRYHELGPEGGARRLEVRGKLRRLSDPAAVRRARRHPPTDTRAHARGEAIRFAHRSALGGGAAWHRVRVGKFDWRFFGDPLDGRWRRQAQARYVGAREDRRRYDS